MDKDLKLGFIKMNQNSHIGLNIQPIGDEAYSNMVIEKQILFLEKHINTYNADIKLQENYLDEGDSRYSSETYLMNLDYRQKAVMEILRLKALLNEYSIKLYGG